MDSMDIPPTPVSNAEFTLPDDEAAAGTADTADLFVAADSAREKFSSFPRKIGGKIGDFGDQVF
jgi:hypothetical protein